MIVKLFKLVDRAAETAVSTIFAAILVVGGFQIFYRFALNSPLSWSEEFQKFGHIWLVFLAVPVAYNRGAHIFMNILRDRLPRVLGVAVSVIVDMMWVGLALSLMLYTEKIIRIAQFQVSAALEIPMHYVYLGLVIGGAYLLFVALRKCAGHLGWRETSEGEA